MIHIPVSVHVTQLDAQLPIYNLIVLKPKNSKFINNNYNLLLYLNIH